MRTDPVSKSSAIAADNGDAAADDTFISSPDSELLAILSLQAKTKRNVYFVFFLFFHARQIPLVD